MISYLLRVGLISGLISVGMVMKFMVCRKLLCGIECIMVRWLIGSSIVLLMFCRICVFISWCSVWVRV